VTMDMFFLSRWVSRSRRRLYVFCIPQIIHYFTCCGRRLRVSSWRAFSIATQTCAFFSRTQGARFHSYHPVSPRASNMIQSWRVDLHMMHDGTLGNCGLMRLRTAPLSLVLLAR
jgi:hypothetical protein